MKCGPISGWDNLKQPQCRGYLIQWSHCVRVLIILTTVDGVLGPFDGTLTFNEAIPMVEKCITITLETNNEFGPQTIVSDVFEITITFGDQTMVELSGQFLIVDATGNYVEDTQARKWSHPNFGLT